MSMSITSFPENEVLERAEAILERRAAYNVRKDKFTSPAAVARYLKVRAAKEYDGAERFTVLFLDRRHNLIEAQTMFRGTTGTSAVYPREVVKEALKLNADAVIFGHNHPSGEAVPSSADLAITERLVDALKLVEVRVLDHVIIGDNSNESYSMAEHGEI